MARVSLILPIAPGTKVSAERVASYRRALESLGTSVEIVVSDQPGLARAAVEGIRDATGDFLLVLDSTQGYAPNDLVTLALPLLENEAEVVVARGTGAVSGTFGRAIRPVLGSAAPFSGLIGLTREAAQQADSSFAPVGARFALELLARTRGRRMDREVGLAANGFSPRPGLDDLRHLKRLADDRLGNFSRLIQFCMVGASGMVVDLTSYAVLQKVFSRSPLAGQDTPLLGQPLDLAAAGGLAIAMALVWNFLLNRRLTFSYAREGSIVRQFLTYALGNALGIALSFSIRLYLPGQVEFFNRHRLAAALVGIVVATGISFSMSRWVVFRRRTVATPQPATATTGAHPTRKAGSALMEASASS